MDLPEEVMGLLALTLHQEDLLDLEIQEVPEGRPVAAAAVAVVLT